MDQRLQASRPEGSADAAPTICGGTPEGEIRVTISADQLMPPIGSEVTLSRSDGTRMPVVLTRIEKKGEDRILVFRHVITGFNG